MRVNLGREPGNSRQPAKQIAAWRLAWGNYWDRLQILTSGAGPASQLSLSLEFNVIFGGFRLGEAMTRNKTPRATNAGSGGVWVVGPLGERLTLDGLPSTNTKRWLPRLKAIVVAAVSGGLIPLDEACERYGLSLEEYGSWQRGIERSGMRGVRTTRVQQHREAERREQRLLGSLAAGR